MQQKVYVQGGKKEEVKNDASTDGFVFVTSLANSIDRVWFSSNGTEPN
ncbi:hypothetical protein RchiOBHm_Chr0c44g0503621 [Rosa chinensis]|uniref:Uncharacterized protein n=1 Tax=Rosa chinensis TaxID=74649 RepID=A0A2P6QP59_ROSCH|nr:hypothetical protein RchiOBHm_Chr4g0386071 [Rosa chinensis]PRQ47939.1 hypothetical protein RchiOBHm_Chr2g0105171 [Rosa chinensis]PRQ60775.1 hypothetical protein RchiOBHm_Chr0c44g0503621 [Rosa chinensis]